MIVPTHSEDRLTPSDPDQTVSAVVYQELWIRAAVADSEIQVHGMSSFRPWHSMHGHHVRKCSQ